jgi:hypothetical protein
VVEGLTMLRVVLLALVLSLLAGACRQEPQRAEGDGGLRIADCGLSKTTTKPGGVGRIADGGLKAGPAQRAAGPAQPTCLPAKEQTGPGCDMAGIMAAVRPLRAPGAAIPACYLAHVRPPVPGKLRLRFSLTPEGRGTGWQWNQDDFDNADLRTCLREALAGVAFPAPGDKPCQVVYPFTFIPEAPGER